jgi:hypothetical protein
MPANEIKIIIGGDPAGFERAARRSNDAIDSMNKAVSQAGAALSKSTVGINQANFALTNLGRIAQDAPFGFIGIQNNINPLIESFQRLKAETGSTGTALKALGSSLIGAGGLGLAISLATAAMTIFSQSSFGAKKELEGFAKAQQESNKQAGEEIAHLKTLAAAAANITAATKDRQSAAKELTKALKENNVQLTEEEALNGRAAKAIDTATLAILARARARAIENRVAELSARNLDREIRREELTERLTAAQKKLNEEQEKAAKSGRLLVSSIQGRQAQITVENLKRSIAELDEESKKATTEIDKLLEKVTKAPKTTGGDKVEDLLKRRIDALKQLQAVAGLTREQKIELAQLEISLVLRDAGKSGLNNAEIRQQIQGIIENAFKGDPLELRAAIKIVRPDNASRPDQTVADLLGISNISDSDIEKAVQPVTDGLKRAAEKAQREMAATQLKTLNEALARGIADLQEATIGGFAEGIANLATQGGGLQAVFKGAADAISTVLDQMGRAFVAYGIALEGFKLSLKSLNGLTAIAAGAGLILAARLLKNIKIPAFADGVTNFSGGLALVGERGPELVRLPRGSDVIPNHMIGGTGAQQITVNVVGRMSGKDVVFVGQRAIQSNKTTGGGGF